VWKATSRALSSAAATIRTSNAYLRTSDLTGERTPAAA
jgi:hypothetical protein